MSPEYELGLIGAGFMAEAVVAAAVDGGLLQPDDILASDPSPQRRDLLLEKYGIAVTPDNGEVARQCEFLVLAVKPQVFDEVAREISSQTRADQALISIMAGVATPTIEAAFGPGTTRVVRVMPNLPMTLGAGMAGYCPGRFATAGDVAFTERLFNAAGRSLRIDDEELMDAVTAVSGSGPAYFYLFTEALIEGGIRAGLSRPAAELLAKQTCLGAARMMLETGEPPATLRAKVVSKGGTTAAALDKMADAGVAEGISAGVVAAFERGRELGSGK